MLCSDILLTSILEKIGLIEASAKHEMHQNTQAFAFQKCTGILPTITNHNIFYILFSGLIFLHQN